MKMTPLAIFAAAWLPAVALAELDLPTAAPAEVGMSVGRLARIAPAMQR